MNDLDADAIQLKREMGQEQYADGLEWPVGVRQPAVGNGGGKGGDGIWKNVFGSDEEDRSGQRSSRVKSETFIVYPVVLSMALTVLVVFVFIKLRGLLLFRRLLSLFVSS